MKIVFMGTPDFAVPSLKALVEAGYDVAAVVTQPDKPKGRGKSLLPTPVKEEALLHEIPVYQPQRVKNNREFLDTLREIAPDVIVVAAFGQIIPRDVLELPKYGCINIHELLLQWLLLMFFHIHPGKEQPVWFWDHSDLSDFLQQPPQKHL